MCELLVSTEDGDFLQHRSGCFKKTASNKVHFSCFFFFFNPVLATLLKVHQETKQHMRRLVQGVLAFLSVAMSVAVWNNKDRASKRLVHLCDKRTQESLVMSL